jgi:hypothetical protein
MGVICFCSCGVGGLSFRIISGCRASLYHLLVLDISWAFAGVWFARIVENLIYVVQARVDIVPAYR